MTEPAADDDKMTPEELAQVNHVGLFLLNIASEAGAHPAQGIRALALALGNQIGNYVNLDLVSPEKALDTIMPELMQTVRDLATKVMLSRAAMEAAGKTQQ